MKGVAQKSFSLPERILDKSKARFRRLQNSPAAQTLVIADLALRQDLLAKTLLTAAQMDIVWATPLTIAITREIMQMSDDEHKTMMDKTEAELKFEEYRQYLQEEAIRLISYIRLYKQLHELRHDRLNEMNIAPAFFQIVIDALFPVIVIWVDKMFSKKSERGLWNFLTFCEHNCNILEIKELQRRRNYADDHWMLQDRKSITFQTIQHDKIMINELNSLSSFKLRRDKFHAHFDKEYFFDREKLSEDAPLIWSDLEAVVKIVKEITNRYSVAYDGSSNLLEPINVTDIRRLLDRLHKKS